LIILNESVTGGYAKIATVISTDLPKVAQLKPGDRVRFGQVLIEEAHRLLREQEERIKRFRDALHDRL
jgi:antagonist of KipI